MRRPGTRRPTRPGSAPARARACCRCCNRWRASSLSGGSSGRARSASACCDSTACDSQPRAMRLPWYTLVPRTDRPDSRQPCRSTAANPLPTAALEPAAARLAGNDALAPATWTAFSRIFATPRACCCARPSSPSSSSSRWPSASAPTPRCSRSSTRCSCRPCRSAMPTASSISTRSRSGIASRGAIAAPNFLDWRAQAQSFDAMSVYAVRNMNVASAGGEPERLPGRLHLHVVLRCAGRPADPRPHVPAVGGRARAGQRGRFSATGSGSGVSAGRRR